MANDILNIHNRDFLHAWPRQKKERERNETELKYIDGIFNME